MPYHAKYFCFFILPLKFRKFTASFHLLFDYFFRVTELSFLYVGSYFLSLQASFLRCLIFSFIPFIFFFRGSNHILFHFPWLLDYFSLRCFLLICVFSFLILTHCIPSWTFKDIYLHLCSSSFVKNTFPAFFSESLDCLFTFSPFRSLNSELTFWCMLF